MKDILFANQEIIFPENINDNVKNVLEAIKSDNQQKRVIMSSHDSYNKLEDDPVAIKDVISQDNTVKNAQDSSRSRENQKRKILNNYDSMFQYECPYGNLKTKK